MNISLYRYATRSRHIPKTTKRLTQWIWQILLSFSLLAPFAHGGEYEIGSGIYDITGPAADAGMVGYGETSQTTKGISTRLWSRAYVIASPQSGKRVVFVSADLQSITQGVKAGVIKKLKSRYGNLYNNANVMLTATHTHVGPGGYDHYVMLNMSALGYNKNNYNVITDGIFQSIVKAHDSTVPGSIYINSGELANAGVNRNPGPYNLNPDRTSYSHNTNRQMTLLKLLADNGHEVGAINWFAVHNVSYGTAQRQISGDNKGIASQLFEKQKNHDHRAPHTFVAAFANSNLGDVSPNVCGPINGCGGSNDANAALSANKQFNKAKSLYDNAQDRLYGALDFRHQYVYLPGYQVSSQYTNIGNTAVCEGAIGWSMTAGSSWDGPSGIPGIFEGMTVNNEGQSWDRNQSLFDSVITGYPVFGLMNAFSNVTVFNQTHDDPCQYPKPTFLNRRLLGVELYTAHIPFQLFVLDSLAIVASAGEMTTMSGRRLATAVQQKLSSLGVNKVVIAGLANAYHGYVTTPEEYTAQHYEGGHTIYGPNTLPAYLQIYDKLAQSLVQANQVPAGPTPPNLSNDQIIPTIGVVYDDKRLWESFGQTWNDAKSSYNVGETVRVKFRAGHPKNNFRTQGTFIEVQRLVDGNWQTWLTDNDITTRFVWIRDTAADCLACSFAEAYWTPDDETPEGSYRIRHYGHWKSGWDGKIRSYSGKSRTFTVDKPANKVSLKTAHNQYLVAENNGGQTVNADRTAIGRWETFNLILLGTGSCVKHGSKVGIKTDGGYYFSAQSNGHLDADRENLGSWETFTLINHSDAQGCIAHNDLLSVKSAHNSYVVAESNGKAYANRSAIGSWEKFRLHLH